MGRISSVRVAQLWRERLDRQKEAECSVAEFCRREGISQPAFYHWRKRLQLQSDPRQRRRRPDSPGKTLRFVPVAMPTGMLAAGVQIDLPSGAIVRLAHHASAEIVAAAVRAAGDIASRWETPSC